MKEKIKNLFSFFGAAWRGSIRGKIGIFCMLFAMFMFVRIFLGDVNVQQFIINIWRLHGEQEQLTAETTRLETYKRHIDLLQNYSPDYVQELGLKYLNIGDPEFKILKI